MKKQMMAVLLGITVVMSMSLSAAFANTAEGRGHLENAEQLKDAIASYMEDGILSETEESQVMAQATEEAISELMQEKLDAAADMMNTVALNLDMKKLAGGTEYAIETYDLGDGCQMTVELTDRAEGQTFGTAEPLAASTAVWKAYGNRYFTAKTTVTVAGYSVVLGLENHYILSSKGIDENYGTPIYSSDDSRCLVTKGNPVVTDGTARTPGASDVNMYCTFTCKAGSVKNTYKLDTAVQYLEHDTSGKRIKVGHTWNLTKI